MINYDIFLIFIQVLKLLIRKFLCFNLLILLDKNSNIFNISFHHKCHSNIALKTSSKPLLIFRKLFEGDNIRDGTSLKLIRGWNKAQGLITALKTDKQVTK